MNDHFNRKAEFMGRGRNKSKQKFSREQASVLIMGEFGRNPKRIYNYKQLAKLLFINDS